MPFKGPRNYVFSGTDTIALPNLCSLFIDMEAMYY